MRGNLNRRLTEIGEASAPTDAIPLGYSEEKDEPDGGALNLPFNLHSNQGWVFQAQMLLDLHW